MGRLLRPCPGKATRIRASRITGERKEARLGPSPATSAWLSTPLSLREDLWRIRVGDYRVIYSIDDDARIVDISAVRHRSDAYR
ncbi:MAG: type II toxin-antitoxin system RelE/ParE family toxin [Candidatus Rokubacteria bacterium]|nr:type II toxin-antitoxin system RelE/ParE family toxin [Candidatus Rokubacteria bacterium]